MAHMPSQTSDLLPLYQSDETIPELSMPTSFQLFDVSEDNRFLALIDDDFMLQAYKLSYVEGEITIQQQTMKDIPCEIDCKNHICVFISVASETGSVVISFLQMDKDGKTVDKSSLFDRSKKFKIYGKNGKENKKGQEEISLDNRYSSCRIYQGNRNRIVEIPFQGRAVFTKDRLVLVGRWVLDVYDATTLKKMYFFKTGSFYLDNYADFNFAQEYIEHNWLQYCVPTNGHYRGLNSYNGIANMSAHIRQNVVVVYDDNTHFLFKNCVKIWSIVTGTLICSFQKERYEYVASISEDHRFLVTHDTRNDILKIYCMNSGTQLHTYQPQYVRNTPHRPTIEFVKIIPRQNYIVTIGTPSIYDEDADKDSIFFLEIFSVEQLKRIKYVEKTTPINLDTLFPIDILQRDLFPNSSNPLVYFPFQFSVIFLVKADTNKQHSHFKTVPFIEPEANGLYGERLWGEFTCKRMGFGNGGQERSDIFNHRLGSNNNMDVYLLENGNEKLVLRFSSHAMQLWRLTASDEDDASFASKDSFNNTQELSNYYVGVSKSTLVSTRSYLGLTEQDFKSEHKRFIHFTDDVGRILVYIELNNGRRIIDEISLPILKSKTLSDSNDSENDNSCSSTDDESTEDIHIIESCLLALRYRCWSAIYIFIPTISFYHDERRGKDILEKTEELLLSAINRISYFQTISISKILVELAIFGKGRDIISYIVLEKGLPLAIHNYPTAKNENLLTVLIQNKKIDLFQILFNKSILSCHDGLSINLFPLMDALVCLQKNQMPGLLLKCIDNLSYLPVNVAKAGLLKWEYQTQRDERSFNNFTAFYRMKKYHSAISSLIHPRKNKVEETTINDIDTEIYFDSNQICFIPVPNSRIYDAIIYAARDKNYSYSKTDRLSERSKQLFPIVEILLTHRWKTSIKEPFYMILLSQIIFFISYTVAIAFPEEVFDYAPGSPIRESGHFFCLVVALLTWIFFLLQEGKQMVELKWRYLESYYNYFDIFAGVLPLATFILLVTDGPFLYDISSLTGLILCLHFLLRLRVFRSMGILIEIIIQLGVKITPIIGLMIFLIFSFTYSFAILLRRQDDGFFQEQFEGNMGLDNEGTPGPAIQLSDQSQQNLFKDPFLAFSTVWFFLYGIFDPINSGDVGNYPTALILAILFSFITALVILNVVIALMTGAIDETEKKGNRNWHIHLADVSSEVLPWLIRDDDAKFVYYHASKSEIKFQHEKLENETKLLKDKMMNKEERGT